jgi:hypothetical protein
MHVTVHEAGANKASRDVDLSFCSVDAKPNDAAAGDRDIGFSKAAREDVNDPASSKKKVCSLSARSRIDRLAQIAEPRSYHSFRTLPNGSISIFIRISSRYQHDWGAAGNSGPPNY